MTKRQHLFEKPDMKTLKWYAFIFMGFAVSMFFLPLGLLKPPSIQAPYLFVDLIVSTIFGIDALIKYRKNKKMSWVHIISSLPFELISLTLVSTLGPIPLTIIRCLGLLKLTRFEEVFAHKIHLSKKTKVSIVIVSIAIAIHWITCGWMAIVGIGNEDFLTSYNKALYWAVTTLTTVGYGDITPKTNFSRLYTIVVMLGGVTTFGLLISHFFQMMLIKEKYSKHKNEQMEKLHSFLTYYDIPVKLRSDVYSYYGHVLNKNITEEDLRILKSLPNSLQDELNLFMRIKLIKKVHIFEGLSDQCLKLVAKKLEQKDFTPNSLIIKQGEKGDKMFIIAHGNVEVISNEHIIGRLQEGQFFGEIALIEDTIRVADVRTNVYCDLYTLSKIHFLEVTKRYPELEKRFKVIYKQESRERKKAA